MRDTAALLTPKQRQYLEEPEEADIELDGAAERMNRMRIRERSLHGILDFQHLLKQDAKDRQQVFEKTEREKFLDAVDISDRQKSIRSKAGIDDDGGRLSGFTDERLPEAGPGDELLNSISAGVAYFYLGLLDRGMSKEGIESIFTDGIATAVRQAGDSDQLPNVDVEISIDFPSDRDFDELAEAFVEGEELTREERELLLEHAPALSLEKIFHGHEDE